MTGEHAGRPARVAAIAAALLLIAGCGGDDPQPDAGVAEADGAREEYVHAVRDAIGPVAPESQQLIAQVRRARSIGDLARPLDDAEDGYRAAMRELESVAPPADVAELHKELVNAQQLIADATREAKQAAEDGDSEGLDEFSEAGDRYAQRSRALSERFSKLGYEL